MSRTGGVLLVCRLFAGNEPRMEEKVHCREESLPGLEGNNLMFAYPIGDEAVIKC